MATLPSPLPLRARLLLRSLLPVVPRADRADWVRSWAAELWCSQETAARRDPGGMAMGVLRDALWLRLETMRRALDGTALFALLTLGLLVLLTMLPALAAAGGWRLFRTWLLEQSDRFLLESALIVFVSYVTASGRAAQTRVPWRRRWVRAGMFSCSKAGLLLSLAFLLSGDLCHPLRPLLPFTAELLENLLFVVLALFGLRWSFDDGAGRCRECLRSLAAPARVGRPSYNFMEWNGTELACHKGHGLLSVPELETSWCRSSAWISQRPVS